jgi:hypothetical protein
MVHLRLDNPWSSGEVVADALRLVINRAMVGKFPVVPGQGYLDISYPLDADSESPYSLASLCKCSRDRHGLAVSLTSPPSPELSLRLLLAVPSAPEVVGDDSRGPQFVRVRLFNTCWSQLPPAREVILKWRGADGESDQLCIPALGDTVEAVVTMPHLSQPWSLTSQCRVAELVGEDRADHFAPWSAPTTIEPQPRPPTLASWEASCGAPSIQLHNPLFGIGPAVLHLEVWDEGGSDDSPAALAEAYVAAQSQQVLEVVLGRGVGFGWRGRVRSAAVLAGSAAGDGRIPTWSGVAILVVPGAPSALELVRC